MRWNALLLPFAMACSGHTSDKAEDTSSDDTGDTSTLPPCPDEVPEAYRDLWDCSATSCDGGPMVYHTATGTSDDAGAITVTEQWFVFDSREDYCVETFEITGQASSYDPATFKCSQCEEIYEITWEMSSGNACGLIWGKVFIDDKDNTDGPFSGYVMFDTHNSFGDRNPDDAMLVISAPVDGNHYYPDFNYGRGTASPTSGVDGPPESYDWVSNGACWQSGR